MTERWLPVVGYEGRYEVSDHGGVRSLDHVDVGRDGIARHWRGKVMKTKPGDNGYPRVNLTLSGKQKLHCVHVLMLEAFVGLGAGAWGRHLNDVSTDNRIENLAWGTPSDNNFDIVRNGNHVNANKTRCKHGHDFTPTNTRITRSGHRCCIACERSRPRRVAA